MVAEPAGNGGGTGAAGEMGRGAAQKFALSSNSVVD